MAESSASDLNDLPRVYQSSRSLFDVLVGDDYARPLLEAISTADLASLEHLLAQPRWIEVALARPHCIYHQYRPSSGESDVRDVLAMQMSNIQRMVLRAAETGQAAAVSLLLDLGSRHGIDPSAAMERWTIERTIEGGHAAVFKALAAAHPPVVDFDLGHGTRALDMAVDEGQPEILALLLESGAKWQPVKGRGPAVGSFHLSLLCRAVEGSPNLRMTQLLLQHGVVVKSSGALHSAAERGEVEIMEVLVQYGADVNEQLLADSLPGRDRSLIASRTPMHFAAAAGQSEAMKWLEDRGAKADILDETGKTPQELLQKRLQ